MSVDTAAVHGRPRFAVIPEGLELHLSGTALRVWLRILHYADHASPGTDRAGAVPGQHRLADELGVSESTVRRAIRECEAAGWLVVEDRRRPDGSRTTSHYTVLWTTEHNRSSMTGGSDQGGSDNTAGQHNRSSMTGPPVKFDRGPRSNLTGHDLEPEDLDEEPPPSTTSPARAHTREAAAEPEPEEETTHPDAKALRARLADTGIRGCHQDTHDHLIAGLIARHGADTLHREATTGTPPDHINGVLHRWRDLDTRPPPATRATTRCPDHGTHHPVGAECGSCAADRLGTPTTPPPDPGLDEAATAWLTARRARQKTPA